MDMITLMAATIQLKAPVELGVVPTHIKFVGGLVPDEAGNLPRGADGRLLSIAELASMREESPVPIQAAQVPFFPGVDPGDTEDLFGGIKALGMSPHMIMMVAGGNPMDPADEDTVCPMLVNGLTAAQQHGVQHVSSTSIEEWMKPGALPLTGADYEAAVAQNVKLHVRACREAGVDQSQLKAWHIEFLRGVEFQTFTDVAKAWTVVKAANEAMGRPFFKVLVDAAHCGDSELNMEQNAAVVREMADAGGFSMFHASAKTTRGCLSTDDGWIGNLLTECAATGKLEVVLV
ncbi:MAG: hypothetical protein AAF191_20850, partial [Verrucomicrobiota bacterium]